MPFRLQFDDDRQATHPANVNSITVVVVLSNAQIDPPFMKELKIRHPAEMRAGRVQYLEGSALSAHDMQRAKIESAVSVFVLSARTASHGEEEEDAATILRVKSILRHHPAEGAFVTLCQSMNKEHAINAGIMEHNIICMRQFRLQLCAKSCEAPGFNTLVANLVSTRSNNDLIMIEAQNAVKAGNVQVAEFADGA